MDNFRYILQPYRRSSDRHICPSCGHKGEFSFYIDRETGQPLHPSVGKCNRGKNAAIITDHPNFSKTTRMHDQRTTGNQTM